MVEAVYRRGFETLRDALNTAASELAEPLRQQPDERIVAIAIAYRRFALDRPALYALMFERPLPDFEPSAQLQTEALGMTLALFTEEVSKAQEHGRLAGQDPVHTSYLLWTAIHGITNIELTHARRSPLPGWADNSAEAGEQVLVNGIQALLAGLRLTMGPAGVR